MSEYIFAYHGGKKFESPEEGKEFMGRWRDWSGSLGDVWVNPGSPVGMSKTVGSGGVSDDGGSNPLTGYSIIKADSIDAAIELAKGCPHCEHGTIEVAELMDMEM